jgi:hypothetical protein
MSALSGSRARLWGPNPTVTVAVDARDFGPELSYSLLNRGETVNRSFASGLAAFSNFEHEPLSNVEY